MKNRCDLCRTRICAGGEYAWRGQSLCEACCLRMRETRQRKTHWQYLGSIRTGYLQPASESRKPGDPAPATSPTEDHDEREAQRR